MLIWLSVRAQSEIPGNLENVRALMDHSAFDIKNPNKVGWWPSLALRFVNCSIFEIQPIPFPRYHCHHVQVYSLLGGFTASAINFHAKDGSGYRFFADALLKVDKVNPQVAARMASAFSKWRQVSIALRRIS